jgi:hypothetical protein
VSKVRVIHQSECSQEVVENFVIQHEKGLIYSTPSFQYFLANLLSAEIRSLVALDDDNNVLGTLPLLAKRGPYGLILNSLPFFGSNGGVLSTSTEVTRLLVDAYNSLCSSQDVALSVWISHPFCDFGSPRHHFVDERIAQWTPLTGDSDFDLNKLIDSSARRNIAKAHRSNVSVTEDSSAIDYLQTEHVRNMTAIGGKTKPPEFFSMLREQLTYGKHWRLYSAVNNGERIAALLTFEGGKTVEYVMPVVSAAHRGYQPTAAILRKAMTDAVERGYKTWNWGGTWLTQPGVYRFKKKWGALDGSYKYYVTVNNESMLLKSAHELAAAYPFFYTIPYQNLEKGLKT